MWCSKTCEADCDDWVNGEEGMGRGANFVMDKAILNAPTGRLQGGDFRTMWLSRKYDLVGAKINKLIAFSESLIKQHKSK